MIFQLIACIKDWFARLEDEELQREKQWRDEFIRKGIWEAKVKGKLDAEN